MSNDRPPQQPDDVLDSDDVARRLGVTPWTARRKMSLGQVPGAFKVGHLWRITRQDFANYVEGLRAESPGGAA